MDKHFDLLQKSPNYGCNKFYYTGPGGQRSNLHLNVVHFSTPVLIGQLRQLKTIVFQHQCLIRDVQLHNQCKNKIFLIIRAQEFREMGVS